MSVSPEKLLISSILRDTDYQAAVARGVTADMFHSFREEWEWLEDYYTRHRKCPSKLAFANQFGDFRIKAVNDTAHFADEVRKSHSRYLMTSMVSDVADQIADGKLENAVALIHTNMVHVAATMGTMDDGDIFSSYDDVYQDIEMRVKRVEEKGYAGIPTGFPSLDERTGGPQPGQLWIIGARLGQGKSWTMQAWATAAVMHGYTVQFDALEQSRAEVAMRIHGFLSSQIGQGIFKTSQLMQGRDFDLKEYRRFLRRLQKSVSGRLHIADSSRGRVGLTTVASQIERNHPDIVFIDYLTLMDKRGSDWQDVAALSAGLKSLATEYQIPIVAAAQLNREKGLSKEPPGPEALAQSDAIGQDADAVITHKQNSPSTMTSLMAKYRHGAAGYKWYSEFNPGAGIFREITYDKWLQLKDKDAEQNGSAQ